MKTNNISRIYINSFGIEFILLHKGFVRVPSKGTNTTRQQKIPIEREFYIGKYPITQQQWNNVMGYNPSVIKGDTLPVTDISWDEAQEFIVAINNKEKSCAYRLPTHIEWEYACKGCFQNNWFLGDDLIFLDLYAWYSKNSGNKLHPVGKKQPNPWGLYDMYGNVWEWTLTPYAMYDSGSIARSLYVIKGGCYKSKQPVFASNLVWCEKPETRKNTIGFRILKHV